MRLLIYTDNHFCQYSSIVRSRGKTYSTRLENQIESINWVERLAEEYNCDEIINLGDFFDRADLTGEEISALKDIKWSNIPHKFIVGNHEISSNDLIFNSLNALIYVGEIINTPSIRFYDDCEIVFLPYTLEYNRISLKDTLNSIGISQEPKKRIILSHNDIAGIRYGQYESKSGIDINEIMSNCDLFVNGHLHNQTQVNDKILNLGNITGQNFSEDGFKYSHCAAILDTATLHIDLINNPYALYFYKIEVNDITEFKDMLSKFNKKYSVATIKAPINIVKDIKEIAKDYFLEFRMISIPDTTNLSSNDIEKLTKIDHIESFKNYVVTQLNNSWSEDMIQEEFSHI